MPNILSGLLGYVKYIKGNLGYAKYIKGNLHCNSRIQHPGVQGQAGTPRKESS